MKPLQITSYTTTTALGTGLAANWQKLLDSQTGLSKCQFFDITDLNTWVGEVEQLENVAIAQGFEQFDCRNNLLSQLCLQQDSFIEHIDRAIAQYGADRVGVFVGTSTSGIHQTERAYLHRPSDTELPDWYRYETTHNTYSVAEFVRNFLGLKGVSTAISTACSSSAKVFASAYRAIESGMCDAAVVGGTDSLCLTTLYGFNSLQLVSEDVCRPSDALRSGLSIGEGAGFALLERPNSKGRFGLLGYGESSDAYHMSSPHPDGLGAQLAMKNALATAGCDVNDIDYIHLHGTGTSANDLAEAQAINSLFGSEVPCSSTKGWTGHTLGAAGIVGAAFSLLCLEHGVILPSLNTREVDANINTHILLDHGTQPVHKVLTNAFGFGGSNCSLILGELP